MFSLICKECKLAVGNSNNVLARHIRKVHKIEWPDYYVKHEYGGSWPVCLCGCGERLEWKKGGFSEFVKGHSSRGTFNGMHGLKGEKSPNFGKVRSEEHKQHYSEAAYKQWSENYDKKIAAVSSANTCRKLSESLTRVYATTNHAEKVSKGVNRFWAEDPRAPELRHEASLRAIDLLEQGKIGPSAPYKVEMKFNPFTDQEERMHSSYETAFLDKCISSGKHVTKDHQHRIPYKWPDGTDHNYVPDFYAKDENALYETKGLVDEFVYAKWNAAVRWCDERGMRYVMLAMSKGNMVEMDLPCKLTIVEDS